MRKIYTLLASVVILVSGVGSLSAQSVDFGGTAFNNEIIGWTDLYNLSFTSHNYGTARSMAMGNAFTALGADMVSASLNPAGIGMYVENDVSFSMMMQFTKSPTRNSDAYYNDVPKSEQMFSDHTERFAMSSAGGVATAYRGTGLLTNFNIGFVYNRIADFNSNTLNASIGNSAEDSMANFLCTLSNVDRLETLPDGSMPLGQDPYYWGAVLAYKTYITNKDDQGWYIDRIDPTAEIDQYSSVETRGSLGEYAITFGFNFIDKVYFGATMGIQSLNYRRNTYYGENYIYPGGIYPSGEDMPYQLEYMNYMQRTKLTGTGVNFKVGVTARPVDFLRIGVAYHSPTWFNTALFYSGEMSTCSYSAGNNPDGFDVGPNGYIYHDVYTGVWSDDGPHSWNFRTPSRLLTGVAVTIAKRVIVSADYERSWYQSTRLQHSPIMGLSYTQMMKDVFKGSNTLRVGAEGYILPFLSLRAGYIWNGSTLRDEYKQMIATHPVPEEQHYITAGVGLKFSRSVYLDLAYQYGTTEYTPFKTFYAVDNYDPNMSIESRTFSYRTMNHIAVVTLGFRF